jgi:hypothetical protein
LLRARSAAGEISQVEGKLGRMGKGGCAVGGRRMVGRMDGKVPKRRGGGLGVCVWDDGVVGVRSVDRGWGWGRMDSRIGCR